MGEQKKKRGRKVEGEVWAVDLSALGRDRTWLRYEELKALLKETLDSVKQEQEGDWMVKVCYSIFHLSPRDEGEKVETALGAWGTYDEVGEHVKTSHWHIHMLVWAADRAGALSFGIEDTWKRLCRNKGYRLTDGATSVKRCYDAGKVVYMLWQEIHGAFYASRKSWKWRDMLRKIKGLYGRTDFRVWEVWRNNAELALRQFTGEQILIDMYKGQFEHDADAATRAAAALEKRHDFSDLLTMQDMKIVVDRMRRNLKRRDVMALLKTRQR